MIVIVKAGDWRLIRAPQDPDEAWELAEQLQQQTGILHWVARA